VWNGVAGEAWVDQQELLDRMFKGMEELLVHEVLASGRTHILDVGCGAGSTTLAIARAVGAQGGCIGIDVSEPMLAAANAQAAWEGSRARFIHADAQTYDFGDASFDLIVSRFGVMFFDDPVAAFANLRRSGRDGAELRLIVWRSADENAFMTTGERAAAPLLESVAVRSDGPGQFAFADETRVRRILADSGWHAIEVRPVEVDCSFPAKELNRYITRLGPVGRALSTMDEQTAAKVVKAVLPAFQPYVRGEEVRFIGACWLISARADDVPAHSAGIQS
jgi:SAM-dependent methyltransferase